MFSAGPVVSKSDPQLTTTAEDVRPQYGDVAEKTEMTDSTVIVGAKAVSYTHLTLPTITKV